MVLQQGSSICREVIKMFEGMNYQKEKRKKRLTQKNRKKMAADQKYDKSKRHTKQSSYEDQYPDNWELMNSR